MKFTLERDALHAALARVAKIVERHNTIPILGHIHIATGPDAITLRGTDLDMEAMTTVAADIKEAGISAVPARVLTDFCAKLPLGAQIAFDLDGLTLTLKSGRARATLNVLDASDFPESVPQEASHTFDLPGAALIAMLARVDFAISQEETRYYLNGVYLCAADGADGPRLRAVATDGHRLSLFERLAPEGLTDLPGVIIPTKAVAELRRLAKDAAGPVTLALNSRRLVATIPHKDRTVTLITKLIDGTFPDYERILPRGNSRIAVIDRAAVAACVQRVACVTTEGRKIALTLADGQMRFAAVNPDTGAVTDEIAVEYTAAPVEIAFNSAYLAEILSILTGDRVHLALESPGAPAALREMTDDGSLIVLMPMRA